MSEERHEFRKVMGHFATGVTIVTGVDLSGRPVGLTANAVASVSLVPRLLVVGLDRDSSSLGAILGAGRFGISMLRAEDEGLARRFSEEHPGERFHNLELMDPGWGVPMLRAALAWLACRVWKTVEAGDHTLLLGEVEACSSDSQGRPLVFFRGEYGTFSR